MKWHYHSGNLEKEAHGIHAEQMQRSENAQMNLAMLHAWIWVENPGGVFSADNWALSYHRFGLKPPKEINPNVSKAIFLADGNVDYFLKFIELIIEPETFNDARVRSVVSEYKSRINIILDQYKPGESLSIENNREISELWLDMWQQIKQNIAPDKWEKIERHLFEHSH